MSKGYLTWFLLLPTMLYLCKFDGREMRRLSGRAGTHPLISPLKARRGTSTQAMAPPQAPSPEKCGDIRVPRLPRVP
jgi:hypothetical protein